jgi:hypothetical protein
MREYYLDGFLDTKLPSGTRRRTTLIARYGADRGPIVGTLCRKPRSCLQWVKSRDSVRRLGVTMRDGASCGAGGAAL